MNLGTSVVILSAGYEPFIYSISRDYLPLYFMSLAGL